MDLSDLRRDFGKEALSGFIWPDEPFTLVAQWLSQAIAAEIPEPNAATLSTCGKSKMPQSRMVLVKEFSQTDGFVFYTHYNSRKGKSLAENPKASLLFYWRLLEKQISIEGTVEKVSPETSDRYFYSRPRESRISAVISAQSEILEDFSALKNQWEALKNSNRKIQRPDHWGGYRLLPDQIAFWLGAPHRLHERMVYQKKGEHWTKYRLAP